MTAVAEIAIPPDVEVVPADTEVASVSLELQAVLPAAREARTFTEESLRLWGEGEQLIEAAVLIVCELATNAIRYGAQPLPPECGREPGPESGPESGLERRPESESVFTLRLALQPEGLHIEVRDGSAVLPVQRSAGREDDCGRGLLIIAALAESWTCGLDPDGGKWVRASLSRVPDALMG